MRDAGDICYADVFKDGTGVVEYTRYEDMKYAIRKLDDTKFKSHEGDTSYIRVREALSRSRSRSHTPRSRSPRSRSRSPYYQTRRESPQYSPARSASRSRSRSKSKSLSAHSDRSRS
ncbi:unnamed protein product [Anisakis simplex]|uniref:Probable splicing factor, arginine/serine-rich 3 (inferred by orthology to a C. elegans protein) n=1 Tax=Anisakis simplex TaxID=6269 RepID=A0A0M3J1R8_ANISI|nr:unnamed protein product [Anisakis simplex]